MPEPGSLHRYRVRTIDSVGRPSPDWRETAPVRLEKHVPPPVPVRVAARVLVPDAPDLTADERALLGTSDSAVVVAVGLARRTSASRIRSPPSSASTPRRRWTRSPALSRRSRSCRSGQVTVYRVDLQLDRAIAADCVAGLAAQRGASVLHPLPHAGSAIQMIVETRLRPGGVAPVPITGPVPLALPLTPDRTRPPAWGSRQTVVPITDPTRRRTRSCCATWLTRDRRRARADGVGRCQHRRRPGLRRRPARAARHSAGQRERDRARAGHGRYHGRPELEIPPPLAPVPRVRTPEPGAEPVHFPLDLTPFLPPAAMAGGTRAHRTCRRRRRARRLPADRRRPHHRRPSRAARRQTPASGEPEVEIPIANPDDRAELAAQIRSGRARGRRPVRGLPRRTSRYRDRLFVPAAGALQPPGTVRRDAALVDRALGLPRARRRPAGHVSAGSATAAWWCECRRCGRGAAAQAAIVPDDPPATLRVQVAPDAELTPPARVHVADRRRRSRRRLARSCACRTATTCSRRADCSCAARMAAC